MSLKDNLKSVIEDSGYTITKLNEELNRINNTDNSVQNLSAKIQRGTLKYTDVEQILSVLGYAISWDRIIEPKLPKVEVGEIDVEITQEEDKIFKDLGIDFNQAKEGFTDIYRDILVEEIETHMHTMSKQIITKAICEYFIDNRNKTYKSIARNKKDKPSE